MTTITTTTGSLTIQEILDQDGYTKIPMKQEDIVTTTDIVVHIINLKDFENILKDLETNIAMINNDNKHILQAQLLEIRHKLNTLYGNQTRRRRGLFNAVGSASKWLFGTMNEEDRKMIEKQLSTFKENVQGIDETLIRQVYINTNFNDTIKYLKHIIKSDRKAIDKQLYAIGNYENSRFQENLYYDQQIKIQLIRNKIEHIQDNVVADRYNILHPSILTDNETTKYNINFNKLNHIKLATPMFKNNILIFAIEIPKQFLTIKIQQIIPILNKEKFEIDQKPELIFTQKNLTYKYEKNNKFKEMKESKHCIFKNNCKLIRKDEMEIIELSEDTILIKNANNDTLNQNCNSKEIKIKNNIVIQFSNCTINIKNNYFTNSIEITKEITLADKRKETQNFTKQITFEKILEYKKIKHS